MGSVVRKGFVLHLQAILNGCLHAFQQSSHIFLCVQGQLLKNEAGLGNSLSFSPTVVIFYLSQVFQNTKKN